MEGLADVACVGQPQRQPRVLDQAATALVFPECNVGPTPPLSQSVREAERLPAWHSVGAPVSQEGLQGQPLVSQLSADWEITTGLGAGNADLDIDYWVANDPQDAAAADVSCCEGHLHAEASAGGGHHHAGISTGEGHTRSAIGVGGSQSLKRSIGDVLQQALEAVTRTKTPQPLNPSTKTPQVGNLDGAQRSDEEKPTAGPSSSSAELASDASGGMVPKAIMGYTPETHFSSIVGELWKRGVTLGVDKIVQESSAPAWRRHEVRQGKPQRPALPQAVIMKIYGRDAVGMDVEEAWEDQPYASNGTDDRDGISGLFDTEGDLVPAAPISSSSLRFSSNGIRDLDSTSNFLSKEVDSPPTVRVSSPSLLFSSDATVNNSNSQRRCGRDLQEADVAVTSNRQNSVDIHGPDVLNAEGAHWLCQRLANAINSIKKKEKLKTGTMLGDLEPTSSCGPARQTGGSPVVQHAAGRAWRVPLGCQSESGTCSAVLDPLGPALPPQKRLHISGEGGLAALDLGSHLSTAEEPMLWTVPPRSCFAGSPAAAAGVASLRARCRTPAVLWPQPVHRPMALLPSEQEQAFVRGQVLDLGKALERGDMECYEQLWARLRTSAKARGSARERTLFYLLRALELRRTGKAFEFLNKPSRATMQHWDTARKWHFTVLPTLPFIGLTSAGLAVPRLKGREKLHIVVFSYAVMWPSFLRLLAQDRAHKSRLREVRMTLVHTWRLLWPKRHEFSTIRSLSMVGNTIGEAAAAMGLKYSFEVVELTDRDVDWKCILRRSPDEAQAVCTASELCLLSEGPHLPNGPVLGLFKAVKEMRSDVLTIADQDIPNGDSPSFLHRLEAIFDYAWTTLKSHDAFANPGDKRLPLCEVGVPAAMALWALSLPLNKARWNARSAEQWEQSLISCGLQPIRTESAALAVLNGLVESYPGFGLNHTNHSVKLTWRGTPLFSASSWAT